MWFTGRKELVASGTVTWGSTAASTIKTIDVRQPKALSANGRYRIAVRSAGTTSALTVRVKDREILPTSGTYAEITRFSIGTAATLPVLKNVEGWLLGDATTSGTVGRLYLTNDTAIGTGKGFSAWVKIRMF